MIKGESSKMAISLANHLKQNGVIKYSAYWCPNCHEKQSFLEKAYKKLSVIECTEMVEIVKQNYVLKGIKGFPSWR